MNDILHKHWRDYTDAEIIAIKKKNCIAHHCPYMICLNERVGQQQKAVPTNKVCDYTVLTGKIRDQRPEVCTHWQDDVVIRKAVNGIFIARKETEDERIHPGEEL